MKSMQKIIYLFINFLVLICCKQTNCTNLQSNFTTYTEAYNKIRSTEFAFVEDINTSKSSWISGASYYSCDNNFGYFILSTDSKNYIYKDLPINIWRDFKNANSLGSYYNLNIKNRYQLYLTN